MNKVIIGVCVFLLLHNATLGSSVDPELARLCKAGGTVIQYGSPRTATTLQWFTLCFISHVCARRQGKNVICNPGVEKHVDSRSSFIRIWKQHTVPTRAQGAYVFTTYMKNATTVPVLDHVNYVQNTSRILELGLPQEIARIARLFGLTRDETQETHYFMQWWSILRMCCSSQASIHQRILQHILGKQKGFSSAPLSQRNELRSEEDPLNPHCDLYNLETIEQALLSTPFARKNKIYITYSNSGDPPLYKGFCSATLLKLQQGYDFNNKKWQP